MLLILHGLRSKTALTLVVIAAVSLGVYVQSLHNDFVIWDDDSLVYENPLIQNFTLRTVKGIFTSYDPELYIPLTLLIFQIEHLLFGFAPFFYHFDNLFLHIAASTLIFLLLERLRLPGVIAFGGAVIFAVHPINTEAVAWVSARKDLLASVFSLGSLLLYLRYRSQGSRRAFFASLLLFLLALLSKALAVTLPAVLLLLDWIEGRQDWRKTITEKIPFFLFASVFLVIALLGKTRNIESVPLTSSALLAAKAILFYPRTYLWPFRLASIYQQSDPVRLSDLTFLVPVLLLPVLAVLIAASLRHTKSVAFASGFFLLTLLPSFANFSKMGSLYYASDRYVYLPQIGLLFLGGIMAKHLLQMGPAAPWILRGTTVAVVTVLAVTAHARSLVWKDSETLFIDALKKNERSFSMEFSLGTLRHREGRITEAISRYERALAIAPGYWKALNNLGFLYHEQGEHTLARVMYGKALASNPRNPEVLNNIGSLALDEGKIDAAIGYLQTAIAADPSFVRAYNNLGNAYGRKGMFREGLEAFLQAALLDPSQGKRAEELKQALLRL